MTPEERKALSGQGSYQSAPRLVLNEVLINGDEGYIRKRIWVGRTKEQENEKPEEIKLGDTAEIIFLKVRRRLVQRGKKGDIERSTGEHNTVHDTVSLYEGGKEVMTGVAKEVREKYPELRTTQVIYGLLLENPEAPELVRLTIKGASLGSENKPEGVMDFYQYISSFGDESVTQYVTKLGVIQESGMKTYFALTYNRGEKLSEKLQEIADARLLEVHEHLTKADKSRGKEVKEVPQGVDTEESIDPESIPF